MNIKRAKQEIRDSIEAYLSKDEFGEYRIPAIRQRPILLMGPPGIGKTQIMEQIAKECEIGLVSYTITHHTRQSAVGLPFIRKDTFGGKEVSITEYTMSEIIASVYEKMRETGLKEGILFIDEIHRLPRTVEEILYPAMEDFEVDIIIGKGPAARSFRMQLPKFTLIGATTRAGQLSTPLRDRFGVIFKLELYSPEELAGIVRRSAGILGLPISEDGALEIASRSRGTPRIANRFLKRVRDFAQVMGNGTIDRPIADYALRALEVDELGLDAIDRRMLQTIIKAFGGGPVGLDTLAATVGEEAVTIEDVYEPYLMQIGFLNRTPRGRCVTALAYEHLGLPLPGPGGRPEENASGQINVFGEE